jgi:SAM-dependent methyltransferase
MMHFLAAIFKPVTFLWSLVLIVVISVAFLLVKFYQHTRFVNHLDIKDPVRHKNRDITDPTRVEIKFNVFTTCYLLSAAYEKYVERMNLKGNERVLDFGAGPGSAARFLARKLNAPDGQLTCLDISPTWMKVIQTRLSDSQNIRYRLGDIRRLELEKEFFDMILIHFVLHDIDQEIRHEIINRLSGLLKPGGRLYIREPRSNLHGMQALEIRQLMQQAGLKEARLKASRMSFIIPVNEGIYLKKL